MTLAGRTGQRLVLACHVAALAGGFAYAWSQWRAVAAEQDAVQQSRLSVQDFDRRLANPGAAPLARRPTADPFVAGQTVAIAGANLQDQVVSAVRQAGGTVTSSQIENRAAPPEGGAVPPPLMLTVTFELGILPLQAMLYALESGTPALFVDRVSVDAPEGGRGDVLRVSMTVSGFWRGETKS